MSQITTHQSAYRRLWIAFFLGLVYLLLLFFAALKSESLSLFANAGHMLVHNGTMLIALIAATISVKKGYHKVELIGGYTNALLLLGVAAFVAYEALERTHGAEHAHMEIDGSFVGIVALIGLGLHALSAWVLHGARKQSLNVHAAYLHVFFDVLATLITLATGIAMHFTGIDALDSLAGVLIALLILISGGRLLVRSTKALADVTPKNLSSAKIQKELEAIPHVQNVHEIQLQNLGGESFALSAHIVLKSGCIHDGHWLACRKEAEKILQEKFGISQTVLQIEVSEEHAQTCEHPSHE